MMQFLDLALPDNVSLVAAVGLVVFCSAVSFVSALLLAGSRTTEGREP